MRGFLFGLILASGALVGSAGCGRVSSSTGSNTNWLERCDSDADCGSGSQCWCNACTATCASDGDCSGGVCRATDALGCGVPGVGTVCVAECANDADCAGVDSSFACLGGACLPGPGSSVGGNGGSSGSGANDAGTGDTAGTSGSGGSAPVEPRARKSFGVSTDDTCVVTRGELYCWGDNLYGQTGVSPAERRVEEFRLIAVPSVTQVALNGQHTCALTANGEVYCWGFNDAGQTGAASAPENTCPDYVLDRPGDYPCQPTPTRVEGVSDAVEIAVGRRASCARLGNGTIQCWGELSEDLVDVALNAVNATGLEMGSDRICALHESGYHCSFDLPVMGGFVLVAAEVRLGPSTPDFDSGCFIGRVDREVVCFGPNQFGQLGTGQLTPPDVGSPVFAGAVDLALGDAHACLLGEDGQVLCWGKNTTGAVGPAWLASPPCGYDTCEPSPVYVPGTPPIVALAAGGDRTCAFAGDGTLWCWGADFQSFGAPQRIAGPWETNGAMCGPFLNLLAKTLVDGFTVDHSCVTDADCVEVPLDISCHQTCAVGAVPVVEADGVRLLISQNEKNTCPQVRELGCQEPEVSCPEPTTHAICDAGYCTRADPEHSGCTDQCACSAERAASLVTFRDECEGFDLWPAMGWPCPSCEEGAAYVVVMNRGSAPFSGEAVISWDAQEGGADTLPDPITVTLELEPSAISAAIRIPSRGAGPAMLRVTAEGDCNPLDDAGTEVTLPSANAACD